MLLEIQLQSLIYSFVYGYFFSIVLNLNYKYLFNSKAIIKVIINILFIIDNVFLYYILLRKINNGIVHYYFIIMIFLGFIFCNYFSKKIRRY